MEAANLGAWMAPFADARSTTRSAMLRARADPTTDPDAYVEARARSRAAMAGRRREPRRAHVGVRRRADQRVSPRTSPSTSPTASAKTACSRSPARASSTRRAARAPNRRSSPTPRRTASRCTRCAARWCSSGATSSSASTPSSWPRSRRQAAAFGWSDLVHVCDEPDEVRRVHRPRTIPTRPGGPASSGGASHRGRLTMPAPVVHAPAARLAVPRGVRPDPGRVRRARPRSPTEVDAEAAAVARAARSLPPGARRATGSTPRDIPFVTIDPPGSARSRPGVPRRTPANWVPGPLRDRRRRRVRRAGRRARPGVVRARRHALPPRRPGADAARTSLGEGAASLLAGAGPARRCSGRSTSTRPARPPSARLERATVRSRAALDYPGVQAALDRGDGRRAAARCCARSGRSGAPSKPRAAASASTCRRRRSSPTTAAGSRLEYEAPLAGRGLERADLAARRDGSGEDHDRRRPGIVRTLPPPQPQLIERLRRIARALGVAWPRRATWGDVVARARSHPTRRRRVPDPGRARAPGRGLREARRDEHCERGVGADPRRCRGAVRARHRALAPPRRPLRERDRARLLRGRRPAGMGGRGVGRSRHGDATGQPTRSRGRARGRRRRRMRGARAERRAALRRCRRRQERARRHRAAPRAGGHRTHGRPAALGETVAVTLLSVDPVARKVELAPNRPSPSDA